MHTVGLHSALAIKRQRKRREELKRSRERRYSSQSTESGIGASSSGSIVGSTDRLKSARRKNLASATGLMDSKIVPPIGMLHIGIVFLVLGLFLVGSGLIPDDYTHWDQFANWWNELVLSGLLALLIGIFLISLNHYLSQQEEDELNAYVERQLTRSKSGKRLIKDEETGCLQTKHEKRSQQKESALPANSLQLTIGSELPAINAFSPTVRSPPPILMSPKTDLEKILEEDCSDRGDEDYANMETFNKQTMVNGSISPNMQQIRETDRELVVTRYYHTGHEY